ATLLEYPGSPVRAALPSGEVRRVLMGMAMGLTAIGLIYSPWGRRSGAHMNPSVTWTFYRLRRVPGLDAAFYTLAQFAGAGAGVTLMGVALGRELAHPAVHYVTTRPGPWGAGIAFGAEVVISLILMLVVLEASARPALAPRTGLLAGAIVMLWISIEAPVSGMSMN